MSGRFFFLGSATATSTGQTFPLGDGAPVSVAASTIRLPTAASEVANQLRGFTIAVIAGPGAGQFREIESYTVEQRATVRPPWDTHRPGTASTIVVGIPMAHYDILHIKGEYNVVTGTSGTFRADVVTQDGTATARIFSQTFQLERVPMTAGLSSTGDAHGETRLVDLMPLLTVLGKVFVDVAPSAGSIELFAAAGLGTRVSR